MGNPRDIDFQKARQNEKNMTDLRSLSPEHVASIPGLNRSSRRAIAKARRRAERGAK